VHILPWHLLFMGESSALRAKLQERQKYLKECEEVEKENYFWVRRNGVQFNDWEEMDDS